MSSIRIKNFGPIKEGYQENGGWMDVKKVTVFIGNQGSGKSTVAKLISTLTWLEKAVYRGDESEVYWTWEDFIQRNCGYHRIKNYITPETEIDYTGEMYSIWIRHEKKIEFRPLSNKNGHYIPKIMYVPAERNFLSTIEGAEDVKGLPKALYTFSEELLRSKRELAGRIQLPISGLQFEYDGHRETSYVIGSDYRLDLLEASSGLQSAVPLFLVSRNLALSIEGKPDNSKMNISPRQGLRRDKEIAEVENDENLSPTDKNERITLIRAKYRNNCFVNIVEEIEQNLYPSSQKEVLESLLGFNNLNYGNKLILTTHSPYIVNYLNIAIQGKYLMEKINGSARAKELLARLNIIVPVASVFGQEDVAVYQLEEDTGRINRLPNPLGILSAKNKLNNLLADGNHLFDSLLEIEEDI